MPASAGRPYPCPPVALLFSAASSRSHSWRKNPREPTPHRTTKNVMVAKAMTARTISPYALARSDSADIASLRLRRHSSGLRRVCLNPWSWTTLAVGIKRVKPELSRTFSSRLHGGFGQALEQPVTGRGRTKEAEIPVERPPARRTLRDRRSREEANLLARLLPELALTEEEGGRLLVRRLPD